MAKVRKLLNPEQVCEILNVPMSTLYGWRGQTGVGPPCIKVGRLNRYDPDDLERWLEEQKSERSA